MKPNKTRKARRKAFIAAYEAMQHVEYNARALSQATSTTDQFNFRARLMRSALHFAALVDGELDDMVEELAKTATAKGAVVPLKKRESDTT